MENTSTTLDHKVAIAQKLLMIIGLVCGILLIGSFLMGIIINLINLNKPSINLSPLMEIQK